MLAASQASDWFGLGGVLLGGLLTTGLALFQDSRRRMRDAAMARRLLSSDLATVERAQGRTGQPSPLAGCWTGATARDQQWPVGWEGAASSQWWAAHRQSLAIVLDDRRFQDLATGFDFVEQFQHSLAAGRRPFQYDDAGFLENVQDAVNDAKAAISA